MGKPMFHSHQCVTIEGVGILLLRILEHQFRKVIVIPLLFLLEDNHPLFSIPLDLYIFSTDLCRCTVTKMSMGALGLHIASNGVNSPFFIVVPLNYISNC